jgi:hypothetical protein
VANPKRRSKRRTEGANFTLERRQLSQLLEFSGLNFKRLSPNELKRWWAFVQQIARDFGPHEGGSTDAPSVEVLEKLVNFAFNLLNMWRQVRWNVEIPAMIWRGGIGLKPRATGGLEQMFKFNSLKLAMAEGKWLRRCGLCTKLFVARKQGAYCTAQHAQVAATHRYRARLRGTDSTMESETRDAKQSTAQRRLPEGSKASARHGRKRLGPKRLALGLP